MNAANAPAWKCASVVVQAWCFQESITYQPDVSISVFRHSMKQRLGIEENAGREVEVEEE